MSRRCQVCRHTDVARINLARAAGASLDTIAKKYSVGRDAVHRHWHKCVTPDEKAKIYVGPAHLDQLLQKAAAESDSIVDYLKIARTSLLSAMAECVAVGDGRAVAAVANALLACLERLGKMSGEIAQIAHGNVTNNNLILVNSPAFATLQAETLRALAPFPEARAALIPVYRALDAAEDAAVPSVLPKPPLVIEARARD